METPTTGQYSLLHQAESWLARQVGTDLLEFPGNHMTYLTEPAAVADGLRPLRERSAEPDSRPGIDLGGASTTRRRWLGRVDTQDASCSLTSFSGDRGRIRRP
jgi:hypothetical protein